MWSTETIYPHKGGRISDTLGWRQSQERENQTKRRSNVRDTKGNSKVKQEQVNDKLKVETTEIWFQIHISYKAMTKKGIFFRMISVRLRTKSFEYHYAVFSKNLFILWSFLLVQLEWRSWRGGFFVRIYKYIWDLKWDKGFTTATVYPVTLTCLIHASSGMSSYPRSVLNYNLNIL